MAVWILFIKEYYIDQSTGTFDIVSIEFFVTYNMFYSSEEECFGMLKWIQYSSFFSKTFLLQAGLYHNPVVVWIKDQILVYDLYTKI